MGRYCLPMSILWDVRPIFYVYVKAVMKREMDKMTEGDYSLMSRLLPVLAHLPGMDTSSMTTENLARLVAREVHGRIYNDSIYEILSWSMRGKMSSRGMNDLRFYVLLNSISVLSDDGWVTKKDCVQCNPVYG